MYSTGFAFLDETKLVVAQADVLGVYDIGRHTNPGAQTTQTSTPLPLCTLALPPLVQGVSWEICDLKCQTPPPSVDPGTIFERDGQTTVLMMLIASRKATGMSHEMYILVISGATLLRRVHTALGGSSFQLSVTVPRTISWYVWGAPRSCLFHIPEPEDNTPRAYRLSALASVHNERPPANLCSQRTRPLLPRPLTLRGKGTPTVLLLGSTQLRSMLGPQGRAV